MLEHCFICVECIGFEFKFIWIQVVLFECLSIEKKRERRRKESRPNPLAQPSSPLPPPFSRMGHAGPLTSPSLSPSGPPPLLSSLSRAAQQPRPAHFLPPQPSPSALPALPFLPLARSPPGPRALTLPRTPLSLRHPGPARQHPLPLSFPSPISLPAGRPPCR
jgi:hypothetical protein